jgi:hypothetical protein
MPLTSILTMLVTITWTASFVVRIYIPTWTAGTALDTGMLLVLGYWFGTSALRKNGNGKDDGIPK